eukprot:2339222-Prymnesium_polylepis.1
MAPAELAEYFRLDRTERVQEIMDRLAKLRAEACLQALVAQGIHPKRLEATWKGRSGVDAQKVDFIPHASRNRGRHQPLPAGIPFRLLHKRHHDPQLVQAMAETRKFMAINDVHFNGAGEERLPRAEQAWEVEHLDTDMAAANRKTLRGVADILRRFPDVCLEVHGQTGAAHIVPRMLAAYLNIVDRQAHVRQAMDKLAEFRAAACRAELVRQGIEPERLFVSYTGCGAHIKVDFTPRSMRPYGPMQPGDHGEYALILDGTTTEPGDPRVRLPLQANAALYVDEEYVLQVTTATLKGKARVAGHCGVVLGGDALDIRRPITIRDDTIQANYAFFGADAERTDKERPITVDLQLSRISRGAITVKAVYAKFGTSHWSAKLELPSPIQYTVHGKREVHGDGALVDGAHVHTGNLLYAEQGHSSASLPHSGLAPGEVYEVRVAKSATFVGAAVAFEDTSASIEGSDGIEVKVSLERVLKDVRVQWMWPPNA